MIQIAGRCRTSLAYERRQTYDASFSVSQSQLILLTHPIITFHYSLSEGYYMFYTEERKKATKHAITGSHIDSVITWI